MISERTGKLSDSTIAVERHFLCIQGKYTPKKLILSIDIF
jgi:hypothetical protein